MGFLMLIVMLIIILARYIIFIEGFAYKKIFFLIFSGLIIVLVFSARNAETNIGSDLNNYYRLYIRAIQSSSLTEFLNSNPFEKGYLLINWLLSRIIKWPQFILFFQAAFCIGITFRFIYKHSDDWLMSVLGFMSFGVMQFYLTGFRQSIAISICLIALEMAEKRKLLKFVLLVALAASIHQTAIIFFVVYILVNIPITKITIIIETALVLVSAQFVPRIIALGNDVFEKDYTGGFGGNSMGGLINVVIAISVLGLMYLQLNLDVEKDLYIDNKLKRNRVDLPEKGRINFEIMPILLLGTGFYCLRYQALVLERISLYFTPTLFILFPQVINHMFSVRSRKLLRIIALFGMVFLSYWRLRNVSYSTFW